MTQRPLVSVLVAAHDAPEGLVASLDSALAQDYPPERLEARRRRAPRATRSPPATPTCSPARVRVVVQPNAGPLAAIDRALHEARGELLAPLQPGDRWPAGRVSAQVGALQERSDVGLVYAEHLGADGRPPSGRPVAQLLCDAPCIAPSSIMLRASLLPALGPLPAELPRAPWWLAVRAAMRERDRLDPGRRAPADAAGEDDGARGRGRRARGGAARRARRAALVPAHRHDRVALRGPLGEVWSSVHDDRAPAARRMRRRAVRRAVAVTDADRADARAALADAREALARRRHVAGGRGGRARRRARPVAARRRTRCSPRRSRPGRGARAATRSRARGASSRSRSRRSCCSTASCSPPTARASTAAPTRRSRSTRARCCRPPPGRRSARSSATSGSTPDDTAHLIAVLGPIDASVRARAAAARRRAADAARLRRGRARARRRGAGARVRRRLDRRAARARAPPATAA